ncbi:hypothetical protein ABZV67_31060 [Streptomyces sp. NPDC005065]
MPVQPALRSSVRREEGTAVVPLVIFFAVLRWGRWSTSSSEPARL